MLFTIFFDAAAVKYINVIQIVTERRPARRFNRNCSYEREAGRT
jgi:hypothetical protein